jgi:FlaG/FlaF family flagellin (archaellin)
MGLGGRAVSEERRSVGALATLAAGVVIGAVEVVLAISFAALVFGGYSRTSWTRASASTWSPRR